MRQRKFISLEEKLDEIRKYECNKHIVDSVNETEISKLTLGTIRKKADKIKETCKSARRMTASKTT
jgi:hypothetical protein